MTEIILVRHGETEWNVKEVFRGRIDIALNETGSKQAALLGEYFKDFKIDAIYSSPLKRTLQTAQAIADHHGLNIEPVPGLLDLDYGKWQGLSREEVEEKYAGLYAQWINNPHQVRMPGGESLNDVSQRAVAVVNEALARYSGTVVLVSHRVVNKVLICALLGLDNSHFWNIRQDTCGTTTFVSEDGRFILVKHNDTSYLKLLGQAPRSDF